MTEALLKIKDLKVNYRVFGGELQVLNGLNLEVRPGEKVGLVGETGCGKTTTMKTILRILHPAARVRGGEILFEDQNLLELREKEMAGLRRNRMSAIFQNPSSALNPVFTVGQQLRDAIRHSSSSDHRLSKEEIEERAIGVLEDMALPDAERLLKNYPVQLSGGMRQRICIALALVTASDLLIADEPGTNLDVTIQDQILRLLMKLVEERRTATIYITHTLGVVRQFMDRVYVMYAGNTVEVARTRDLFDNPVHPYTRGLMEAVPKLTGEEFSQGIPGRVPEYLHPPTGCRFHPRCEERLPRCSEERPGFIDLGHEHQVACFKGGEE